VRGANDAPLASTDGAGAHEGHPALPAPLAEPRGAVAFARRAELRTHALFDRWTRSARTTVRRLRLSPRIQRAAAFAHSRRAARDFAPSLAAQLRPRTGFADVATRLGAPIVLRTETGPAAPRRARHDGAVAGARQPRMIDAGPAAVHVRRGVARAAVERVAAAAGNGAPTPAVAVPAAAPVAAAQAPAIDVPALTQRVYQELERRIRLERERRGI
jgi:hypothetical protein